MQSFVLVQRRRAQGGMCLLPSGLAEGVECLPQEDRGASTGAVSSQGTWYFHPHSLGSQAFWFRAVLAKRCQEQLPCVDVITSGGAMGSDLQRDV